MRKVTLLYSLFLISSNLTAANYYLANLGSDSNTGISSTSPWQSITKLNTLTYTSGDTVFFKCGDIFRGDIIVNQGGSSSAHVVFTAYGTGSKPVISGTQILTGWSATGNYYTASYSGTVTNFFVNKKEQTLARYPNEHVYLTLDSAQTAYLNDASVAGINSNLITGSKICVHSSQWSWEKSSVAGLTGNKISFGSVMLRAINNYGYFLYDNINHLDTANEWKYDATAQLMYYYPQTGINPNSITCEISIYQNGIEFGSNVSNITISNLSFEGQANAGVQIGSNTNHYIIINNCNFFSQYKYGVNVKGKYCQISNCLLRDIDGMAVYINGSGSGATTVDHTVFKNIGVSRVSGIGGQLNGTALMCASDSNYMHHNSVDSTGYCGISADGAHNIVERNTVDHAVLIENDGGAIKGWGASTTQSIYRNNFITNSDGCTEGTYQASFVTPAIYFDFNVNNCTISNNTVFNHSKKGIFQNSSNYNNTIKGNVIYGGSYLLDLNGSSLAPNPVPISGMIIKHNSFFSKDNNSIIIRQVDYSAGFNAGTLDSNYYFQPYNPNRYALRINGTTPTYYTFSSWQATGKDPHTVKSFVNWVLPVSYDTLLMNPTDNVVTINLGTNNFLDLDSNIVCGNITLQPYTSQILINIHTACTTTGIIDHSASDQIVVYPNPSSNEIKIINQINFNLSTYEIIDATGRIVLTGKINSNNESIKTDNLQSGLYFILLKGDKMYKSKLIKE